MHAYTTRRAGFALSLFLHAATAAQAPIQPAPVDVEQLGPQVGEHVPDFTAVDQDGRPRSLRSLFGPEGLMLVFFRSADW